MLPPVRKLRTRVLGLRRQLLLLVAGVDGGGEVSGGGTAAT